MSFFLKNRQFQIVHANRLFFERLGFTDEHEIVGKQDFELFPRPLATKFRADDKRVLSSGESMPGMVELFLNRQGLPNWYLTTKLPVIGRSGTPVGVMGTVQRYDQHRGRSSTYPAVAEAVNRMLDAPGEIDSIEVLAQNLGMSHRNFDRRFKEVTGLSPRQYLGRARIQVACSLLKESTRSISDIAIDLGYCDQSAFTAQFRTRMGLTPFRYRKQFI